MRSLYSVALALVALALSGCLSDAKDPDAPATGGGDGVPNLPQASATFRAQFDPAKAIMPYPNDILGFLAQGSTDGTLNLPVQPFQLAASSVNELDGFSIFSRIQANFTGAVEPASLNPLSVFLIEVALDPATRAVIGLSDGTTCKIAPALIETCTALGLPTVLDSQGNPFLVQGADYELSVAPDVDSGNETIQLDPLKALNPFTFQQFNEGAINGYLLIITDRVTRTDGQPAAADTTYAQIRAAYQAGQIPLPPPPGLPADQLLGVFVATHLAVVDALSAAGAPVAVSDVVVTASFSTQDTTAVLQAVSELAILSDRPSQVVQAILPADVPLPGGGVLPAGTPVTTALLRTAAGFPPEASKGNGDIYVGGINIPYFQELPTEASGGLNVLASKWVAEAGANILGHPTSTVISRWNRVPVKRADLTIPLIMAIPNENSAWVQAAQGMGVPVPLPTGWPVVIYQPGFLRNRADIVLVAEPWLDQGYAVIAIDLPFHGITFTDPSQNLSALLRVPGTTERTFDLDLRNNANLADLTPDGLIDPSSANLVNPAPAGLLTTRDNLREAAVGVLAVRRSLGSMDIDGDPGTSDLDASQVHYVGHSGGGILGGTILSMCDDCATFSLPSGAAGLAKLIAESDVVNGFGFIFAGLRQGLAAQGITSFGSVYNNYIRDLQHVWNEGDPIGYLHLGRQTPTPVFGSLVNTDVGVPPSASVRLFEGLGLPQIKTPGVNFASKGYTRITEGEHGSYIRPVVSLAATVEMQTQVAVFLGGNAAAGIPPNGQVILISNPDVVETE
jgi:pimeloyl-ACP methyl ester carboxylesterase